MQRFFAASNPENGEKLPWGLHCMCMRDLFTTFRANVCPYFRTPAANLWPSNVTVQTHVLRATDPCSLFPDPCSLFSQTLTIPAPSARYHEHRTFRRRARESLRFNPAMHSFQMTSLQIGAHQIDQVLGQFRYGI